MKNETMDIRPKSKIVVNNVETNCLLDTGSEVTIVDLSVLLQMFPRPKLDPFTIPLNAANGTQLTVIGQTTMKMTLGTLTMNRQVLVVKGLRSPCIFNFATR